ncbi:bifunctional ADP-dependent NAD(P)H-hydrate dehydratase/NAD(P)H-hydrate epimerase [Marinimicrobium agarilyticum]|uniref:bifunctional ADP-dependent NAD(P)H-hydrate dehydratase/NAD(P)H-hydrate epimerase n=1 Tax=Marinimicrobium agarilyticum TaxID=306546 RepID=UPI00040795DB|nr:bifunctional ADP-dependent NAD(P)H-hydrate dehydratase/NAD(P)H-hydrate epimerase [Marinimicrobium agarilyticum]
MKLTSADASGFPRDLYTAEQTRELDRRAVEAGTAGIQLMKRAGRTAFEQLLNHFPAADRVTVYCGAGNNAGDGYVVAALAAQRRLSVSVITVGEPDKLKGEAAQARDYARQEGVEFMPLGAAPKAGVIVDALLGTGVSGEVRPHYAEAIEQINQSGLPVLAIDLPSGLAADSGAVLGVAVQATVTVTFIGVKQGLLTARGAALCGELVFARLGVSDAVYDAVPSNCRRLALSEILPTLGRRAPDAHKGAFGHVMVIGGDTGFGGAAIMAAEAAARAGAGLVSLATRPEHVAPMLTRRPEIMVCGVTSGQELEPWLARPTVLVVGPGLGQSPWSEQMLQQALQSGLPLVLDADALNLLAAHQPAGKARDNWILTPHPGEAARLLQTQTAEVQRDRFAAVHQLQHRYGGAAILKGAGSLVCSEPGRTGLVAAGNPGMASGGMGDVLSGLLGGLLAQGLSVGSAAELGACLHAEAADLAVGDWGERSLLATDLIPAFCQLLSLESENER